MQSTVSTQGPLFEEDHTWLVVSQEDAVCARARAILGEFVMPSEAYGGPWLCCWEFCGTGLDSGVLLWCRAE